MTYLDRDGFPRGLRRRDMTDEEELALALQRSKEGARRVAARRRVFDGSRIYLNRLSPRRLRRQDPPTPPDDKPIEVLDDDDGGGGKTVSASVGGCYGMAVGSGSRVNQDPRLLGACKPQQGTFDEEGPPTIEEDDQVDMRYLLDIGEEREEGRDISMVLAMTYGREDGFLEQILPPEVPYLLIGACVHFPRLLSLPSLLL